MGDFVPHTLSSSPKLDEGICVTIMAYINVSQYIIHTIQSPLHYWRSARASTMRWYGLPTKPPLSVLAFGMSSKLYDKLASLYLIYVTLTSPGSWRSRTIISSRWYHQLLLNHCISPSFWSKENLNDQTSVSSFPTSNTLHTFPPGHLMANKGVYGGWQYINSPPSHVLA